MTGILAVVLLASSGVVNRAEAATVAAVGLHAPDTQQAALLREVVVRTLGSAPGLTVQDISAQVPAPGPDAARRDEWFGTVSAGADYILAGYAGTAEAGASAELHLWRRYGAAGAPTVTRYTSGAEDVGLAARHCANAVAKQITGVYPKGFVVEPIIAAVITGQGGFVVEEVGDPVAAAATSSQGTGPLGLRVTLNRDRYAVYDTDRGGYQEPAEMEISISVTQTCYVTLISCAVDGTATLLFPNRWEGNNQLAASTTRALPANRDWYFLRMSGTQSGQEDILAIATRDPYQVMADQQKSIDRFGLAPLTQGVTRWLGDVLFDPGSKGPVPTQRLDTAVLDGACEMVHVRYELEA